MGKKNNKKTVERKERIATKQSKKAAQKEKKVKAKGWDADSDAEDVDLDAILATYAQEQAKFLKVTEIISGPPSPRSSCTLIASPASRNEVMIFGGEYFDGTVATFYNNLFIYLIDRGEWREVTSPNSPLPRSGHAWCRAGSAGGVYLFGGKCINDEDLELWEFSSPKQGTFYHYNDFWHLDPTTKEWSRIETKGKGPPARSGHRMTYFKHYIILFGGFQDTSQQTKYLQDLWIYDCQKFTWYNPTPPPASQRPDPRSSFSFLPHEKGALLFGGYARVKTSISVSGKSAKTGPQRLVLKPMVHQDSWFLCIKPPDPQATPSTGPSVQWERRKRPANLPTPPRAGATMAYHKGRGIMFGGVHDIELSEEGIDSEFFDALFTWNAERNRFFQLSLRRPKGPSKKQQMTQIMRLKDRSKADEGELLRNLAALEAGKGIPDQDDEGMDVDSPKLEESPKQAASEVVRFEMPHPRFNSQLAVQGDTLFVFGGTFEKGDQEFTFNDLYSIDLVKLDGVREIFYNEPLNWNTKEQESEDEEEVEDDDMESDEGSVSIDSPSTTATELMVPSVARDIEQIELEEQETENLIKDSRPHPRPFESLRDFFNRTSDDWQIILIGKMKERCIDTEKTLKELRKEAFDLAEEKWWDSREEVMTLEDEQEAAGIGEVVSISERSEDHAGSGRRR